MPTPTTHRKWGKAVAQERLGRDWSTLDLAIKVGVNPTSIWRIERGDCAPSDVTRVRLAHVFGRRVEDLFPYPTYAQVQKERAAEKRSEDTAA